MRFEGRRPARRGAARLAIALGALATLASCSWGRAADPVLLVTVHAPAELRAHGPAVSVTQPGGERITLDGTTTLTGLTPGDYVVEAADVELEGRRFVALPPAASVTLLEGASVTVPITYVDAEEARQLYPPAPAALRPGARTFHVDCQNGSDANSGLGAGLALATLEGAGRLSLAPGDSLLLRRGCTFTGPLVVRWQGTEAWPVTIGAYGEGDAPVVTGASSNNVDVHGSHVVIEHVRASTVVSDLPVDPGCRDQPVAWRTGFTVQHEARDVTLRYVAANGNTAGVHITRGAERVRVLHSHLHDNVVMSVNTDDGDFDDSGAWGVLVNGSSSVVAYNTFTGNNAWCSYDFGQEGASIEVYEGVDNLFHHNLSIEDTTFSEIGSSSSRASRDNVFAFNVYASSLPVSQFLVLRGDDAHFGPTHGTGLYHNTVYLTHPVETQGIVCYAGCGPDLLDARNNVIWVEWKALYADAPFTESHNLYWNSRGRPHLQLMADDMSISASSMVADPQFLDAAAGDFRLAEHSPAVDAGSQLELGFATDAAGEPLPQGTPPDLGAFQRGGTAETRAGGQASRRQ